MTDVNGENHDVFQGNRYRWRFAPSHRFTDSGIFLVLPTTLAVNTTDATNLLGMLSRTQWVSKDFGLAKINLMNPVPATKVLTDQDSDRWGPDRRRR